MEFLKHIIKLLIEVINYVIYRMTVVFYWLVSIPEKTTGHFLVLVEYFKASIASCIDEYNKRVPAKYQITIPKMLHYKDPAETIKPLEPIFKHLRNPADPRPFKTPKRWYTEMQTWQPHIEKFKVTGKRDWKTPGYDEAILEYRHDYKLKTGSDPVIPVEAKNFKWEFEKMNSFKFFLYKFRQYTHTGPIGYKDAREDELYRALTYVKRKREKENLDAQKLLHARVIELDKIAYIKYINSWAFRFSEWWKAFEVIPYDFKAILKYFDLKNPVVKDCIIFIHTQGWPAFVSFIIVIMYLIVSSFNRGREHERIDYAKMLKAERELLEIIKKADPYSLIDDTDESTAGMFPDVDDVPLGIYDDLTSISHFLVMIIIILFLTWWFDKHRILFFYKSRIWRCLDIIYAIWCLYFAIYNTKSLYYQPELHVVSWQANIIGTSWLWSFTIFFSCWRFLPYEWRSFKFCLLGEFFMYLFLYLAMTERRERGIDRGGLWKDENDLFLANPNPIADIDRSHYNTDEEYWKATDEALDARGDEPEWLNAPRMRDVGTLSEEPKPQREAPEGYNYRFTSDFLTQEDEIAFLRAEAMEREAKRAAEEKAFEKEFMDKFRSKYGSQADASNEAEKNPTNDEKIDSDKKVDDKSTNQSK